MELVRIQIVELIGNSGPSMTLLFYRLLNNFDYGAIEIRFPT